MRAVIYARYSTDLQSAASIDDQLRLCRERIERDLAKRLGQVRDQVLTREPGVRGADLPGPPDGGAQACASCSTANDPDAKFCKGCGRPL